MGASLRQMIKGTKQIIAVLTGIYVWRENRLCDEDCPGRVRMPLEKNGGGVSCPGQDVGHMCAGWRGIGTGRHGISVTSAAKQ